VTKGCIAAGNEAVVDAGLYAFRKGGNAVDAAIAAQLSSFVTEPLLTGLGGAGIALVRANNQCIMVDGFTTMPLGASDPSKMKRVDINFGPTTQKFFIGRAAVATPTFSDAIGQMHRDFATLPMSVLAAPAKDQAVNGTNITEGFARVIELLWPIICSTKRMRALFGSQGERKRAGDVFYYPDLVDDLDAFSRCGHSIFKLERYAGLLDEMMQGQAALRSEDVERYRVRKSSLDYIDCLGAKIWLPAAPSIGGHLVRKSLEKIGKNTLAHTDPFGEAQVVELVENMEEINAQAEVAAFLPEFFRRSNRDHSNQTFFENLVGNTTHISVVDEHGSAVSMTSSLGETCGEMLLDSGIILNNFLGESDVAPGFTFEAPGARLMTMCTPTLATSKDCTYVLGSGGSSRIRTAVLHGILYRQLYGFSFDEIVKAPRVHVESGTVHIESFQRTPETMEALEARYGENTRGFHGPNMFFGGLHTAAKVGGSFEGAGDFRRSGAYGES
jgi:gamma-glutamyltranspeptidase / glutathione hydrolase